MNVKRLFRGFVTTLMMTVLFAGTAFAEYSAETETVPNTIGISQWPRDSHLKGGEGLNAIFKELSGVSGDTDTVNTSITAIRFAVSAPDSSVVTREVQISGAPVYAWFDAGTIYLYSEAEKIYAGSYMYYMCSNMQALTDISALKEIDMSEAQVLTCMFKNCTSLTDLTPLSSWNTSSFVNITSMFYGCSALSDVSPIKDWDTSHITKGTGQIFYDCSSLSDASCLSTHKVNGYVAWGQSQSTLKGSFNNTVMDKRYRNDHSNLFGYPNWYICDIKFVNDGSEYATVRRPLNPSNLYEDVMPENPTKDGFAFQGWNVSETGDGDMLTFNRSGYCLNPSETYYAVWKAQEAVLKKGRELNVIFKELSGSSYAYYDTPNYNIVKIRRSDKKPNAEVVTQEIQESGGQTLAWFNEDEGSIYWWSDAETVFANASMNYTFYQFLALNDLSELSEWNMSRVTSVNGMFEQCISLQRLNGLEDWDVSQITGFYGVVRSCSNLTDISALRSWEVSQATALSQIFQGCTSLEDLEPISGWTPVNVTDISQLFESCSSLTDVTCLNDWNLTAGIKGNSRQYAAFEGCSGIIDPSKYPTWYYLYEPAISTSALTLDGNGGTVFGEPVVTITPEAENEADTEPESLSAEYGVAPVMFDDAMELPDIVLQDEAGYGEPEEDVMVAILSDASPSVASASDALRDNILVLPEAEREGFMFLGWSDEEDGEVVYEAGDEIAIDSEMVLYAVWSEEPAVATPSDAEDASEPDVTEATPSEAAREAEDEEQVPPDPVGEPDEPDSEPVTFEVATPSEPKRETDAAESDPADVPGDGPDEDAPDEEPADDGLIEPSNTDE